MFKLASSVVSSVALLLLSMQAVVAESPTYAPQDVRALMADGKVKEAKEALFECADAQVAECQFMLAEWIERGELYERDLETAKKLYELAYSNGHAPAAGAVLRLAKMTAGQSDSDVQPAPTPASPPAQIGTSGPAPPMGAQQPLPSTTTRAASTAAPPAKIAAPRADLAGAPHYFGLQLDELMTAAQAKMQDVECDRSAASVERECTGRLETPAGPIDVTVTSSLGRVYIIGGKAVSFSNCKALEAEARRLFGRPKFLGSRLMSSMLRRMSAEAMEGATNLVWSSRGSWNAIYFSSPVEEMCSLALADAKMDE